MTTAGGGVFASLEAITIAGSAQGARSHLYTKGKQGSGDDIITIDAIAQLGAGVEDQAGRARRVIRGCRRPGQNF